MLTTECINPEILSVLATLGHGDKILITDGNYPIATSSGNCKKVYLALKKDMPTVTDVLKSLMSVINFEKAEVMTSSKEMPDFPIFEEFRKLLKMDVTKIQRYDFYDSASNGSVKLAINTGESRLYANLMLTIGVA